ncbi:DUF2255 family protein [Pseudooceanicola nanhaiensis]|uniref:DUF2255 family protein n=1 Tax=Pseudooceanicola nanhaiensis TaxID=375761 RepID=UPI001CD29C7A|nr:DUF2255 family protein [Pseudooceanicola nanhaiensis]MCA0919248.1 DUF2255 family protein [Pseudooceanicola nanhaiensis]
MSRNAWTAEEAAIFSTADDVRVAPHRPDGVTPGTPTFIWSVVTNGRLFIRAYSGTGSSWFRAACAQGTGQLTIAGETREVSFLRVTDATLNAVIDAAYQRKYASSRYLAPMISAHSRAATVEVLPRHAD